MIPMVGMSKSEYEKLYFHEVIMIWNNGGDNGVQIVTMLLIRKYQTAKIRTFEWYIPF